jgi:sugar phosphate isomerase/epimerase
MKEKAMENTLALNTDFGNVSRQSADIKSILARISGAGFSHVHWCHEWNSSYLYSVHEMLQIREWCDEYGLAVKGIHASHGEFDLKRYISFNDYNRLAGVDLIKNRVDLAYILNAGDIVLHLYLPWKRFEQEKNHRDDFFRVVLRSFDELEPYCKTRRVRICVENLFDNPTVHMRDAFDILFERYDADFMGLCFDTGHANVSCKENILEFAERYNNRLFMIHVHDNNGEGDQHHLPFTGSFNWEGFAALLARSPYSFPVNLELVIGKAEDEQSWLKKALEEGNRLSEMVQKERK